MELFHVEQQRRQQVAQVHAPPSTGVDKLSHKQALPVAGEAFTADKLGELLAASARRLDLLGDKQEHVMQL